MRTIKQSALTGLLCCFVLCFVPPDSLAQTSTPNLFPHLGAEIVAAGVGVGAVVGVTVYLVLHRQTTIEGCVVTTGNVSSMTNEKDHQTYEFVAGDIPLKGGQKLRVKGKKGKRVAGARSFRVKTVVADEGDCGGDPSAILLLAAPSGA
jgi:hypothetical protein